MFSKKRASSEDFGPAKKKVSSHWSAGLYASLEDESLHVFSDDDIVIIKDKYPKVSYNPVVFVLRAFIIIIISEMIMMIMIITRNI